MRGGGKMKNSKCTFVFSTSNSTFVFPKEEKEEILHIYACISIEGHIKH